MTRFILSTSFKRNYRKPLDKTNGMIHPQKVGKLVESTMRLRWVQEIVACLQFGQIHLDLDSSAVRDVGAIKSAFGRRILSFPVRVDR